MQVVLSFQCFHGWFYAQSMRSNVTEPEVIDIFLQIFLVLFIDKEQYISSEDKSRLLQAFSAISNGKKLFSCQTSTSREVIGCFHGIRAIASLFIILSHYDINTWGSIVNSQAKAEVYQQNYPSRILSWTTFLLFLVVLLFPVQELVLSYSRLLNA